MIHVCYALNDKTGRYSKFVGTSMLSLFENHYTPPRSITVHLLHDNTLTLDNYEKFVYLAGQYNQIVKFYNVEKLVPDRIAHIKQFAPTIENTRFTIATMFRLLIPYVLPKEIDKVIYIDGDTIVNLDINELWQIELDDKVLGVVPHLPYVMSESELMRIFPLCRDKLVRPQSVFNAGILLMNLKKLLEEEKTIEEGQKFFFQIQKYGQADNDLLIYCFPSERNLQLPHKFNYMVRSARSRGESNVENKIIHYAESPKGMHYGLDMDANDSFNRLFFEYFFKTPWFGVKTLEHMSEYVRQMYIGRQNLMTQVSAMVSGKRRAFVTAPQNIDSLKRNFYVQEGEDIFQINSQNWLNELANAMKESVGKKIYFMLIGGIYPQLRAVLMQVGFVEGRDFINGEMFLSELHGINFNSYPLIERM